MDGKFKSTEDAQNFHRDNYRSSGVQKQRYFPGTSSYNLGKWTTSQIKPKTKILDVGCNSGILAVLLNKVQLKDCYVNGIDIVSDLVNQAKKNGTYAREGVAEDLSFYHDKQFDYVVCIEVLEHLYDPVVAMKQAHRVLKDDGKYIISIPNKEIEDKNPGDFHHGSYSIDDMLSMSVKAGFNEVEIYQIDRTDAQGNQSSIPHWIGFVLSKTEENK